MGEKTDAEVSVCSLAGCRLPVTTRLPAINWPAPSQSSTNRQPLGLLCRLMYNQLPLLCFFFPADPENCRLRRVSILFFCSDIGNQPSYCILRGVCFYLRKVGTNLAALLFLWTTLDKRFVFVFFLLISDNVPMFPGETLHLHLFEPRYKLMMQRIVNTSQRWVFLRLHSFLQIK